MKIEIALAGVHYGGVVAVDRVDVELAAGEVVAVLGANGAGKSSTLRGVMGLVSCDVRKIRLDGADVSRLNPWRLTRRGIVLVPDTGACFAQASVKENLLGASRVGETRKGRHGAAQNWEEVLELFPRLRERQRQLAGTLSGGERKMLALARALLLRPELLLLDEPSAGLAPLLCTEFYDRLAKVLQQIEVSVILAEQNVHYAGIIASRTAILYGGKVVREGRWDEVVTEKSLRSAYLGEQ